VWFSRCLDGLGCLVVLGGFVLELPQDAKDGYPDPGPALRVEAVVVDEDGKQHTENLARGGDRRAHLKESGSKGGEGGLGRGGKTQKRQTADLLLLLFWYQWLEVGNGVEDEALAHGTAKRKEPNLLKDDRVGRHETEPRREFTLRQRHNQCRPHHRPFKKNNNRVEESKNNYE